MKKWLKSLNEKYSLPVLLLITGIVACCTGLWPLGVIYFYFIIPYLLQGNRRAQSFLKCYLTPLTPIGKLFEIKLSKQIFTAIMLSAIVFFCLIFIFLILFYCHHCFNISESVFFLLIYFVSLCLLVFISRRSTIKFVNQYILTIDPFEKISVFKVKRVISMFYLLFLIIAEYIYCVTPNDDFLEFYTSKIIIPVFISYFVIENNIRIKNRLEEDGDV